MDKNALAALHEDPNFFADLGDHVWLMDDHRWAFYIWELLRTKSESKRFTLVHADYHWDGVNDFSEAPHDIEKLLSADVTELLKMVRKNKLIRYDSFIAPAVLRGMFKEVHFYCKQNDGTDAGLDAPVLQQGNCIQRIHQDALSLTKLEISTPLIFDLCLDLFNFSDDMTYEGDIWPDEMIYEFLNSVALLIERASLVTISLSYGYSGTVEDTRRLAELVSRWIMDARQKAKMS